MEMLLSPKDLAAAIGVSESSVKRWVDEGRIRVMRTAGGHRRIPVRHALQYIRKSGAEVLHRDRLGLGEAGIQYQAEDPGSDEALVSALVTGDQAAARAWMRDRYLSGDSPARICDMPIASALTEVGDTWRHEPDGVAIVHRTTETCLHALGYLKSLLPLPETDAPTAMGCSPEGDPYQVPSLMASLVLASVGWREINLGANLPLPSLCAAMRSQRPALVWISLSSDSAREKASIDLASVGSAAAEVGAEVVVGGRAFLGASASEGTRIHHLANMQALAAYGRGLYPDHIQH